MAEDDPDHGAGEATAADGPRGERSAADGDRDDHETFVRLLLEHEPRVRGYIRGLVPTWHDVDEVVQQASLVAWRKFDEFDRGTNFGSWLMVIARFEALKHRRRIARGPRCLSAWIDGRLDEAGVARLDELLRASPAARDTFRERVGLDALLATMAEQAPSVGDDAGAVQPHAGDGTTLAAGGGIVLDRAGHARDGGRPRDPGRPRDEHQSAGGRGATAFLALDDMAAAAEDRLRERRAAWSRWSETARRDPRLVAFYRFDTPDAPERGGRVQNVADPPGGERDGAAVGVTWTGGRWPGTGAVAFRRAGGRVRVAIDGTYDAVTLACWARVDAVDREYNSLFLTDGYDPGEPHWQIFSDGSLMFSIAYPPPGGATGRFNQTYFSRPVFTVDTLGEWHHVAVTYDGTTGEVVQYFDGDVVGREVSALHVKGRPIRIGPAEIGNWGLPTPGHRHPLRSLNGAIDEFMIHAAVLATDEVRAMAEAGRVE